MYVCYHRLWKYCIHFENKLKLVNIVDNDFNDVFKKKVVKVIKTSIFDYEFPRLVELYRDVRKKPGHNKQPTVFVKTESITQSSSPNATMNSTLNSTVHGDTLHSGDTLHESTDSNGTVIIRPLTPRKYSMKMNTQARLRSDTGLSNISRIIMQKGGKKRKKSRSKKPKITPQTRKNATSDAASNAPSNGTRTAKQKLKLQNYTSIEDDKPVDDATQLIMVLKGIRKYLQLDWKEYNAGFAAYIGGFNLTKITAYQYMSLAFSFANIYLRVVVDAVEDKYSQKSMGLRVGFADFALNKGDQGEFEIDPNVWSLYQELRLFYDHLSKYLDDNDTPFITFSSHYDKIIQYWCEYQLFKYTNPFNGIVNQVLKQDNFRPISNTSLYSTSIIDLFTLLDPLDEWFNKLPYTNKNLIEFAKLNTTIIELYIKSLYTKVKEKIEKQIMRHAMAFYKKGNLGDKTPLIWELPTKILVGINNISMGKTQLVKKLSNNMLDKKLRYIYMYI